MLAEVARDLRKFHDSGTELPTDFDSFRLVEEYAEAAAQRQRAAEGLRRRAGRRAPIEKVVRDQETQPVPATTTC